MKREYILSAEEKKNKEGKGGKYLEKEKLLRDGWTGGWVEAYLIFVTGATGGGRVNFWPV